MVFLTYSDNNNVQVMVKEPLYFCVYSATVSDLFVSLIKLQIAFFFFNLLVWFYGSFVFQAKTIGTAGYTGQFSGYDEYVPMVDKAVDAGWKKSPQKLYISRGLLLFF